MPVFVKGDVIVLPFPFSDLSQVKRRPAIVVGLSSGGDIILCQITSKAVADGDAVPLGSADFTSGALSKPSNIRPNKLFTADSQTVLYQVGTVKRSLLDEVIRKVVEVLQR